MKWDVTADAADIINTKRNNMNNSLYKFDNLGQMDQFTFRNLR